MKSERAVEAETIEPAPARVADSRRAVFALIEERAGLLSFEQVNPEFNTVLGDNKIGARCRANSGSSSAIRSHGQTDSLPYGGIKRAVDHRQPFELANLGVIAFDDQARMEFFDQQLGPH